MKRTSCRALVLLAGALGAGWVTQGPAQAQGIGVFGSIPFDDDCANNGKAQLAPVTNANVDLGQEAVTSCGDDLIP